MSKTYVALAADHEVDDPEYNANMTHQQILLEAMRPAWEGLEYTFREAGSLSTYQNGWSGNDRQWLTGDDARMLGRKLQEYVNSPAGRKNYEEYYDQAYRHMGFYRAPEDGPPPTREERIQDFIDRAQRFGHFLEHSGGISIW